MTEVLFYHLKGQTPEQVLPALLQKSLERGWRVVHQDKVSILFEAEKGQAPAECGRTVAFQERMPLDRLGPRLAPMPAPGRIDMDGR